MPLSNIVNDFDKCEGHPGSEAGLQKINTLKYSGSSGFVHVTWLCRGTRLRKRASAPRCSRGISWLLHRPPCCPGPEAGGSFLVGPEIRTLDPPGGAPDGASGGGRWMLSRFPWGPWSPCLFSSTCSPATILLDALGTVETHMSHVICARSL